MSTAFQRPNRYSLAGDGVTVSYSTTSFSGESEFEYRSADREVIRHGDEIRVEQTGIGELVTVEVESVPDLHTITVSLLVPVVNLESDEARCDTVLVEATNRTSIIGPPAGAVQSFRAHDLSGIAHIVEFLTGSQEAD